MAEMTKELYELCEKLTDQVAKANKQLDKSGGEINASDAKYLNDLTHSIKSIKTTLAAEEGEYSGNSYARGGRGGSNRGGSYGGGSYGGSYRGGSYEGGSYEGGSYDEGSYARRRRDSRGRYSREQGYSRDEDVMSELYEMFENMPERKKNEIRKKINEM